MTTIEDIQVGLTESFSKTISEEMLSSFLGICGDTNPLHCDGSYAKESGFPDRVVYGMLTSSFLSTLAGVYLPGIPCILHSVESIFMKPVFIGDVLEIKGTVKSVNVEFKQIEIKAEIRNQHNEKVLRAKIKAGVRD